MKKECSPHHPVTVAFWKIGKAFDDWNALITALATVAIAGLTIVLARTNRDQLAHARRTERAYFAGGGDCKRDSQEKPALENGKMLFRIEVGNQGKTTAFMYALDIHFGTLAEVESELKPVTPSHRHVDQFPPGEKHRPVGKLRPIPSEAEVVYGAFYYRDIWGDEHYSRFILRIDRNDGHTYSDPIVDHRYWEWT
jgi:hypothetical protein